ncbi:probable E3 ubiquitin-protein ligase MARCHF10 isoform X1 [Peromyscus leucopus]|uniref:probable E3 ubiquitin-protein ligase MARCHF10 isoform X1 n=1 Tax=Peromyscus leucopus TaxID=10041 RepID=UPI001884FFD5|nr:probable E3 ubiquitin-protein ligase MARCHF10 isoform X1 [Peromyscus leucopus]XP_037056621.1 probable E3 ubiquitin-protein ligase MARCHF10 isoform X1 [Peromyscus leucopus]XP_037056622.1 probable E3 ubiquitin-protein ligase MARCHF10 isoform X1 [Peromyscus leucopus]
MLHEARDRQKFVSDVQYLRDMQHKVDSEYQACLKRQEIKKDPNEKTQDQLWGNDTSDRSRFSSGSSSKQSSSEEDSLSEPRSCTKLPTAKCEPRLPAIDQASVKQKHKSTMTPRKPEKVGPSKPSPVAQAPKILSRKRRPNLGRLTVSPEMHSSRASGERSRQKLQLSAKAPAPLGVDPIVQQKSLMCANETKLKRPARERNLASSAELMRTAGKPLERQKKGDPSVRPQNEPHAALSQTLQPMNGSQVLSESLGAPLLPTTVLGPRRAPFRYHDEDFYSALSLSNEQENYDTEEETRMEEELLLVGMRSPPSHKRSRFLGTSTTENRNVQENAENLRGNFVRWNEFNPGSPRKSSTTEPAATQPSGEQRVPQDTRLCGELAKEDPSGDQEEEKTALPGDAKSNDVIRDCAEDESSDCPMGDRPTVYHYERDWQSYLSGSRNSFDSLFSGRATAPRSSMNTSYNTHGSPLHPALIDDVPTGLSMPSILVPTSDMEESLRFNARRPLSPIRNRNPLATAENHSDDIQGAEEMASTSQAQGPPLLAEDVSNPQSSVTLGNSPSSSTRRHLQGHFYMPGSLQENIPFTFFALSDFPNPNDHETSVRVSDVVDEKGTTEIKADPEKLRKLQESLLEEDSDEEEGDLCRICLMAGGSPTNPLLEPCGCVGSLKFVHQECLKKWLKVKITSGADLGTVKTCEMCKQGLLVDLDDFNMTEFYHKHHQSRVQSRLMNSGLYLVLLLHLYEQRFAELMTLNYRRASRERERLPFFVLCPRCAVNSHNARLVAEVREYSGRLRRQLSRNHPQPRPEENESSESGDGNESSVYPGRVI